MCFQSHIYEEAETRTSFLSVYVLVQSFLMLLLYYYGYYCCFFIIIIIIMTIIVLFFGCSCTGTNSCLTFCSHRLQRVKHQLWFQPVWTQPLFLWFGFFEFCFSLFGILSFFLPVQEEKLAICVCCSERTPRFYSLSSFMVPICTILKVLILVYMQNIPVLQQKHVKKIRLKKCYSITLIFSEHCTVALLCASISEAKKKTLK